jgi:SSS family solute:Na+ symporter
MKLQALDLFVVAFYAIGIIAIALWVSRPIKGHDRDTQDYFMAGKNLPWWAIGASLIAANISAEQIIGMSGSGYVMGIAIASYEWMAAITLLIVGKYFIPIFLKLGIYTMPQYLEVRYNYKVRMLLAFFWLGVYIFVNLTAILWLGALAINTITGVSPVYGMLIIVTISTTYSIYGGLKAVALTDIIQVVLLVFGGLVISYLCMDKISEGEGFFRGLSILTKELPEKFDLILSRDNPAYQSLPGISVLIGGMWVMNISYWGFNQYIIQRALAAKSTQEAQKGIAMAAYLKLLMPVLIVLPGVAAVMLVPDLNKPDNAYPHLMTLLPSGLLGLVFAALVAAIVSSVGSMMNSISTIFTLDIYRSLRPEKREDQSHLVMVGRIVSFCSLCLALICARPLLGNFDQAFQYIQEFTGFFTPGIVVIFLLGMFWQRATANAALAAAGGSAILSLALKLVWPSLPFMDRVGLVFICCMLIAILVSLKENKPKTAVIELAEVDFSTTSSFNIATAGVLTILVALYASWW